MRSVVELDAASDAGESSMGLNENDVDVGLPNGLLMSACDDDADEEERDVDESLTRAGGAGASYDGGPTGNGGCSNNDAAINSIGISVEGRGGGCWPRCGRVGGGGGVAVEGPMM